ncbi:MAG: hypothetical protein DSM106950_19505 [Stigonema ocellatum SAG 48.90 = DSM 106950]|nr:hypothetical protein [Stigonema ocellatum SAG 48.90 = DSM 106950]
MSCARALVLKPRIIFFDEATSALDNRTQAIVSESLERLKVTRIAIAHRLSTIEPIVIEHRLHQLTCGRCGTETRIMKVQLRIAWSQL